jgi:hypothetical protein
VFSACVGFYYLLALNSAACRAGGQCNGPPEEINYRRPIRPACLYLAMFGPPQNKTEDHSIEPEAWQTEQPEERRPSQAKRKQNKTAQRFLHIPLPPPLRPLVFPICRVPTVVRTVGGSFQSCTSHWESGAGLGGWAQGPSEVSWDVQ